MNKCKLIAVVLSIAMAVQPCTFVFAEEIVNDSTDISLEDSGENEVYNETDIDDIYGDQFLEEDDIYSESEIADDQEVAYEENVGEEDTDFGDADEILIEDVENISEDIDDLESELIIGDNELIVDEIETEGEIHYVFSIEQELEDASIVGDMNESGISMFSLETYSGCFGNQLDGLAREFYDAYVSAYSINKKTGDYEYTLNTPFIFKAELKNGSIVQNDALIEKKEIINAAMQTAVDAFLYDHPEVFWLRAGSHSISISVSGYSDDDLTGEISLITFKPKEIYTGAASKISAYDSAIQNITNVIENNVGGNVNRYDLLKYIHDYVCKNAYYKTSSDMDVHSAAPLFIGDGGVVCEGYAKTFKVLCDKFDIPCACIGGVANTTSGSNKSHMWNYVQMEDGAWYLVDTTWDDQDSKIYDTYFLVGWNTEGFYETIADERIELTDFSGTGFKNFVYPKLNGKAYIESTRTIGLDMKWGRDNFSFVNSEVAFGTSGGSPYIMDNSIIQSTKFSIVDKFNMETFLEEWGGTCFGMSTMALQLFVNRLNLHSLQDNVSSVYDLSVPTSNQVLKNMLGLYQASCVTSKYKNRQADFVEKSESEKIKILYEKISKIEENGIPVLIDYAWVKEPSKAVTSEDEGWAAHAVLAYALETEGAPYQYGNKSYAYRIRVINPNTLYNSNISLEEANADCIYLTKDLSACYIPNGGTRSDNKSTYPLKTIEGLGDEYGEMKIQLVSDDVDVLPPTSSEEQRIYDYVFAAGSVVSIDGNIINGFNGDGEGIIGKTLAPCGSSTMLNVFLDGTKHSVEFLDNGQSIGYVTSDTCDLITANENCIVQFEGDNNFTIDNEDGDFQITCVNNNGILENSNRVTILGNGKKKITVEKEIEGITISGNSISGVIVSNEQDEQFIIDTEEDTVTVNDTEAGLVAVGKSLNHSDIIVSVEDQYYTGEQIRPVVEVFDGINKLYEEEHFTVEYADNVNLGTGKITLTGIGDYSGKRVVSFNIIEKEHQWSNWEIIKSPTCIQKGEKQRKCEICGSIENEILPMLEHTIVSLKRVEPNCGQTGLSEGEKCSECGKILKAQTILPATEKHSFGAYRTIKEATALASGEQQRECSVCGKIEKKSIAKLPATIKVNMTTIPLKVKQSTTAFKVSGLAKGDKVKSYKSSNTKVATVNNKGKITAKKKGTAKITVTLASGKTKTVTVKVQKGTVKTKKITVSSKKITLKKGNSYTVKPTLSPLTSQQKITYKSSDKKVATVNSKGKITAKKKGKSIVTVKSGSKTVKITVTVK